MAFITFLNTIYFIRDLINRMFLTGAKDAPEINDYTDVNNKELTSIDDAIEYYSTNSKDLYNSIVSSDISLMTINSANSSMKEHCTQLRTFIRVLETNSTLNSFVPISVTDVSLKNYLLDGSEGDLSSSLESYFIASRKFLKLYKKVSHNEVNNRLLSSFAANLIYIKEVFAGIQYGGHDN